MSEEAKKSSSNLIDTNTMKRYLLTLITLAPLLCGEVAGQERQTILTLDQCVERAHHKSLVIRQGQVDSLLTQDATRSSRYRFLPSLGVSVGHSLDLGRSQDKMGVMQDRSSTGSSVSVGLSYELFSGLNRIAGVKLSDLDHQASKEFLRQSRQELAISVAQLFYNLLYSQDLVRISRAQVELTAQLLSKAEVFVKAGKWSEGKLAELQTQYAQEQLNLIEAENNLELARFDLMQAIEWEDTARPLEIRTSEIDKLLEQARVALLTEGDWTQKAMTVSPALKVSDLRIRSAEQRIAMARAGYFPTLSLGAGYSNSYYYLIDEQFKSMNVPFADQLRNNGRYYVGLSLQIPIFDKFATRYAVRTARQQVSVSKLERERALRKLDKEMRQALLNATTAERKISVAETALKQSELALDYAQKGFEAGRISTYDYAQAKTKQFLSTMEALRAKYDFVYKVQVLKYHTMPEGWQTLD